MSEYLDFADIFSQKLELEISEHIGLNHYTKDLIDGKKTPYEPI